MGKLIPNLEEIRHQITHRMLYLSTIHDRVKHLEIWRHTLISTSMKSNRLASRRQYLSVAVYLPLSVQSNIANMHIY